MQVTNSTITPIATQGTLNFLNNLPSGQILRALVLNSNVNGNVTLQINGKQIDAKSTLNLNPGEILNIKVFNTEKQIILKLLQETNSNETLLKALRTTLPRQTSLTPLLANLYQITCNPEKWIPIFPQPILQLAKQLFNQMPDAGSIANADKLRGALRNSGLFLESSLAQLTSEQLLQYCINNDLKALLMRLFSMLKKELPTSLPDKALLDADHMTATTKDQLLPQIKLEPDQHIVETNDRKQVLLLLFRQLEGSLARIQFQQLSSLPTEDSNSFLLNIELPIRHHDFIDVFQLQIRKEPKNTGKDTTDKWTVRLAFNLVTLGPVVIIITLAKQRISASFLSERPSTTALFKQHASMLEENLENAGLELGAFRFRTGIPTKLQPHDPQLDGLIDEIV